MIRRYYDIVPPNSGSGQAGGEYVAMELAKLILLKNYGRPNQPFTDVQLKANKHILAALVEMYHTAATPSQHHILSGHGENLPVGVLTTNAEVQLCDYCGYKLPDHEEKCPRRVPQEAKQAAEDIGKILELFERFMPKNIAVDDPKQLAMYDAYHKLNALAGWQQGQSSGDGVEFAEWIGERVGLWYDDETLLWNKPDMDTDDPFKYPEDFFRWTTEELYTLFKQSKQ